jgi:type I restriction enzyme, S subunit
MSEWKEYKFSDFALINPPVKILKGEKVSFVEMKDLEDGKRYCKPSQERELTGGSRFETGDTLFARITPCLENGKICQVTNLKNNVGFGSTEFHVLRGKEKVSDSNFVFYLSRWKEVRDHAEMNFDGTSGRQRVPKQAFDDLILSLPPLSEQKSIAAVLSSLDDKIDLLHRQNATLETMAEALFKQWFVVEAREEWEEGKIEDLFILQRGFDLPIQSRIEGEYPIIASSGESGYHSEYKVKGPGVTTGRSGVLGNVFYIHEDFWPLNTSLFIKEYKISTPLHSYFVLKNVDLNTFNAGSAVPTLNRNHVHELKIDIPPINLIREFEKIVLPSFKKIKANTIQICTLTTLRDTLLPKLMSGEVRVAV